MKKPLAYICALFLGLSFTACAVQAESAPDTGTKAVSQAESKQPESHMDTIPMTGTIRSMRHMGKG